MSCSQQTAVSEVRTPTTTFFNPSPYNRKVLRMKGFLVLEDGTVLEGEAFGALKEALGEVVFNTAMAGYQESLTDPSYSGQILVASYPLIGNYGVNPHDGQSDRVQVWGYIVKEPCAFPSHRDSTGTLHEFLEKSDVPGLHGIDTRSVIRRIRNSGTMKGGITTGDPQELLEKVRGMKHPEETNLVAGVTTGKTKRYANGKDKTVVLVDCGVKTNIVTELCRRFNVVQVPFDTSASQVKDLEPDGIFISNGPGDPAHPEVVDTTVRMLSQLKDDYPIMGICLGHQLVSIMLGAKTYKLKFGHRGVNQPVYSDGLVYITSQNHGFAVDEASANDAELETTFVNLNDRTVEGVRHRELPIFTVQFHPEARAGPLDTGHLFDRFRSMLEEV